MDARYARFGTDYGFRRRPRGSRMVTRRSCSDFERQYFGRAPLWEVPIEVPKRTPRCRPPMRRVAPSPQEDRSRLGGVAPDPASLLSISRAEALSTIFQRALSDPSASLSGEYPPHA